MNQQLQAKKENLRPIMQDRNLKNSKPSTPGVHENQYTYNFEQKYRDSRPAKRNLNAEPGINSRAYEIHTANTQNCLYINFSNPYDVPITQTKPKNFERKIEMKKYSDTNRATYSEKFTKFLSSSERPQSRKAR